MCNLHNILNIDRASNVVRNRHDFFFDSPVPKKKIQTPEKVSNNRLHYRQEENKYCGKIEEINARLEIFSRKHFVRLAQQKKKRKN